MESIRRPLKAIILPALRAGVEVRRRIGEEEEVVEQRKCSQQIGKLPSPRERASAENEKVPVDARDAQNRTLCFIIRRR